MSVCSLALALLPTVLAQDATADLFARLGAALLASADRAGASELAVDLRVPAHERLVARLEYLHEPVELGLIDLWLPRVGCDARAREQKLARPRVWTDMAEAAVAVQARWYERVGATDEAAARRGKDALESLRRWSKKASVNVKLPQPDALHKAARELRVQLAWEELHMRTLLAPSRAQFAALLGAAGVQVPNSRPTLWVPASLRAANNYFTPTTLAFALSGGPLEGDDAPLKDRELLREAILQSAAHAFSHQLSNVLAPSAPIWFTEGLALGDCVAIAGSDETLCAGYSGRRETALDDLSQLSTNFFLYTRIERSPYRTGGCKNLFAGELRAARGPNGYRILDLDSGREGLVLRGPFLGEIVRMPDQVGLGPRGLKEGYAEFFRAYCAAFVAFLDEQEHDGGSLLDHTLRELRRRGRPDPAAHDAALAAVLYDLTGKTLGASLDPESDLEGAFDASL